MRSSINDLRESFILSSEFVIGTNWPQSKYIDVISTLYKWCEYKDNDWGMKRYHTTRTQSIIFIDLIDLNVLKSYLNDLILLYKNSYPHSTKEDFINDVLSYSVYQIKFLSGSDFIGYGNNYVNDQFGFYYVRNDNEFIDIIIPVEDDIIYVKQYLKTVLELINDLNYYPKYDSLTIEQEIELVHHLIKYINVEDKPNSVDELKEHEILFHQSIGKLFSKLIFEEEHCGLSYERGRHKLEHIVNTLFLKIYNGSNYVDYNTKLSQLETYIKYYHLEWANYQRNFPDANEQDYIKKEIQDLKEWKKHITGKDDDIGGHGYYFNPIGYPVIRQEGYNTSPYRILYRDNEARLAQSVQRKIEYLENGLLKDTSKTSKSKIEHDKIFTSKEGEDLFNYLVQHMGCDNANLSYIFRRLSGYDRENIYIVDSPKEFRKYCHDVLNFHLSKVKTMDTTETTPRYTLYNSLYKNFFLNKVKKNKTEQ